MKLKNKIKSATIKEVIGWLLTIIITIAVFLFLGILCCAADMAEHPELSGYENETVEEIVVDIMSA